MSVIDNLPIEEVYNRIANQFDYTRVRIWRSVSTFLCLPLTKSKMLDIGCGNGKNMIFRKDLDFYGIDSSEKQVEICKNKNLNVQIANMKKLPFVDDFFDYMICIATYHHLDKDKDRQTSLHEMYRCLKKGGKMLLTVFAMEQERGILKTFSFSSSDEMVPWKSKEDGNTYMRYYHIYKKGELEEEIKHLCPEFIVDNVDYELGNWVITLSK
jgi:SAM-dependent methyltransferase